MMLPGRSHDPVAHGKPAASGKTILNLNPADHNDVVGEFPRLVESAAFPGHTIEGVADTPTLKALIAWGTALRPRLPQPSRRSW